MDSTCSKKEKKRTFYGHRSIFEKSRVRLLFHSIPPVFSFCFFFSPLKNQFCVTTWTKIFIFAFKKKGTSLKIMVTSKKKKKKKESRCLPGAKLVTGIMNSLQPYVNNSRPKIIWIAYSVG